LKRFREDRPASYIAGMTRFFSFFVFLLLVAFAESLRSSLVDERTIQAVETQLQADCGALSEMIELIFGLVQNCGCLC